MDSPINKNLLDASKKEFPSRFYNDFFVSEFGRLEGLISERYGRSYSVLLVYLEGFAELSGQVERPQTIAFLKNLIRVVIDVVRTCDVVGMIHGKGLVIILPDTDYIGSLITVRKLRKAVEALKAQETMPLSISFSHASFPRDANGYGELVTVAEKRLEDYRGGLYGRVDLGAKLFWENVSTLLNEEFNDHAIKRFDIGTELELSESFRELVAALVMDEVGRTPQKSGILYVSPGRFLSDKTLQRSMDGIGETNTKIFIIGEKGEDSVKLSHAIQIDLTDNRFLDTFFILLLRDDIAYAFIAREGWGGRVSCVHATEPYLITCLIEKLQRDYSLQEQL
ncbi:MAG: hypothetical protein ACE5D4_06950 [Thermodesulfobacteriota bacterium]